MSRLDDLLHNTSFSRQLAIVLTIAVLCLAFLSSLAISWQGSQLIHANLTEQGQQVADNLARQSKLALIYDAAENVAETVALTLAFPDVVALEIRHADGRLLVGRGRADHADPARKENPVPMRQRAYVEQESEDSWSFVAPVLGSVSDSQFDATEPRQEMLGYVRVIQGKETLLRMRNQVFLLNFAVSFFLAFIFLLVVHRLTLRLTRPLTRLSATMAEAEAGATGIRAEPTGPKEIVDMAQAFNKMMIVLADREQELRAARDSALKFAKLKADFAATVSHEIRTPLNGVVGTLDILMATELPQKQRQFVEIAWDSSQYLLDLINNILDFSKLEAGKVEVECSEFGVAHTIEDVLELLAPQAIQKGLDLGYLVAEGFPRRLKGDPRRLRQVLVNLVGNAVKFTESGTIEVRVGPAATSQPTVATDALRVRFEVIDTGIGISAEAQASIFDSFTQAETSTTRRFGGSGLGLAICKQMVSLLGGEIGVDSTLNRGSCFWFEVPLIPVAQVGMPDHPHWPGLRALIADDSEIARGFLEQKLAEWGFQCGTTDSSDATLTELRLAKERGAPYDLVILDTAFGEGHGHDDNLPLRIRTEYSGKLHLILMNRYGVENVPAAVQADAYLAKPLGTERLLQTLLGVFGTAGTSTTRPAVTVREAPSLGECRVLVVEDNRTNQAIARGMLAVLGCQTDVAANGQEGLLAFKRGAWDLILMDCAMPGMDGYEVTAAIRGLEEGSQRRTPIVAMTANVQASDVEKCLAAGMDDHLPKPLTLDQLSGKLRHWVPRYSPTTVSALSEESRDSDPLDHVLLGKLREVLGSAIGEAIHPFLEDMPTYLEEMEQAAAIGSTEQLRRAAHAIKGAAGNLGAGSLAAVAREIEEYADDGRIADTADMLTRARAEYTVVHQALLAELDGEPPRASADASKGTLVLVVDDDRSTRTALRYALQRSGFAVEEAADGAKALALVEHISPDVILMDAMMPEMDGFTACAKLQETPHGKDIPVLMITALDDNQSIQRAFAAGASDYIPKPINLAVVNQRVKRVVDANRAERYVRHLAFNDALTGLPNRVMFADNLDRAIERADAHNQSLAVLFLDLDRFKFVNDTLGHETGDRLLKAAANRIKSCVRSSDCVARLGGDEFTILLDELAAPSAAASAAQKIRRTLATPFEIGGQDMFITASVGISIYPNDGRDVSTLLRHADTAMYRAKRGGSLGYEFYEAGMEATVSEHLRMDSSLRRALERNELLVYYQPKADTASGRITGMEALVRWLHPTRGMIPPLEFIPLAEETGLINPIGELVLRTACTQVRQWLTAGAADLNMAVNISGIQLNEPGFADLVASVLRETDLDPRHLTLEITESVLMGHAREAVSTLQQLKDIGLRIEIDDFGTGYSSLAYLKRFPVDALKVDRTFTRDMTANADDAAIVSGIVALAHSLRLKVVAEGVETQDQRDFLIRLECDYMQGYYLSEPLPANEFFRQILQVNFPDLVLPEEPK